jgi:2-polyprenyl-3-methyl-5-hydroxy-6-metoxy-1,4-benzoquinol methylase
VPSHTDTYLLPTITKLLASTPFQNRKVIFELGCGNGATAAALAALGYDMVGVHPSTTGIEIARQTHPHLSLQVGSSEEDLHARFGSFPVVISLEVVEHVAAPVCGTGLFTLGTGSRR